MANIKYIYHMYILYDIWKFFNMKRSCFTPLHRNPRCGRNETGWFSNVGDLCDLQLQRKSGKPRWKRWMAVPEIWGELTQSVEGGEGLVVEMPQKKYQGFLYKSQVVGWRWDFWLPCNDRMFLGRAFQNFLRPMAR